MIGPMAFAIGARMEWSDFYLACFAVGFLLSAVSFIGGGFRWHLHLPHLLQGGAHVGGHVGAGHAPVGHHAGAGAKAGGRGASSVSPFNFVTLTAFLAWFGGTGFLITRFSHIWSGLGLLISLGAGAIGATIVFLFMSRVLISSDENMDAADYEMAGVLGRISILIREGGTGEIIYSQAGTRRTCGARSETGAPLAKGAEVMVTRYENGIAWVRLWEEMSGEKLEKSEQVHE